MTNGSESGDDFGLELVSLVKRYGSVEAVRGVDLSVRRGEFLTVLGPSGSGKTTILRMIAGFTDITEGNILLAGRDVSRMTPAERGIGMVFQNYALFPHMTAAENVAYGLKMRGWSTADRSKRVDEMLELVGLAGMQDRLPRELSGGQQQRVALARALAFDPDLLLMDEPLGALDRELRIRMAGELRRIHADLGTTVVYVTHDREEALTLSDRIAVMLEGKIEALDTPEMLYRRPRSAFVAGFFGGHNVVESKALEQTSDGDVVVEVFDQRVTVPTGQELEVPGDILLSVPAHATLVANDGGDGGSSGDRSIVQVVLEVDEAVYMGDVTRIIGEVVDISTPTKLQLEVPGHHLDQATAGRRLTFHLDPGRCTAVPTRR